MRNRLFAVLAALLGTAVALIAAEGIYALVQGGTPKTSLSYQALRAVGLIDEAKPDPEGAYAPYLTDARELSDLIGSFVQAGVGVGNSPYEELRTEEAAMNIDVDGCRMLKANLRKTAFFLRSALFNPFDPLTVFYDADKKLDDRLTAFLHRYGTPPVTLSTNAAGERVTLPLVERPRKVLIAGDSVAFGAMIEDRDTLASQLQARDRQRQYVNLGVSGAKAEEILCRLEDKLRLYAGQVDELIYVYCENDLKPKRRYGKPEEVIARLKEFAERENIAKVTVIFAPYIYTIAPEITRFNGYVGGSFPQRAGQRAELMRAVEAAGFRWVDIGTLAREEQARQDSQFAFFALFVDQVHLSREGTARLVDRLMVE